jgi:hypothetical protein
MFAFAGSLTGIREKSLGKFYDEFVIYDFTKLYRNLDNSQTTLTKVTVRSQNIGSASYHALSR